MVENEQSAKILEQTAKFENQEKENQKLKNNEKDLKSQIEQLKQSVEEFKQSAKDKDAEIAKLNESFSNFQKITDKLTETVSEVRTKAETSKIEPKSKIVQLPELSPKTHLNS